MSAFFVLSCFLTLTSSLPDQLFCDEFNDATNLNWEKTAGSGTIDWKYSGDACDLTNPPCADMEGEVIIRMRYGVDATNYESLYITFGLDLELYEQDDKFYIGASFDDFNSVILLDTYDGNTIGIANNLRLNLPNTFNHESNIKLELEGKATASENALFDAVCIFGGATSSPTIIPTTSVPTTQSPTTNIPTTLSINVSTTTPTTDAPTLQLTSMMPTVSPSVYPIYTTTKPTSATPTNAISTSAISTNVTPTSATSTSATSTSAAPKQMLSTTPISDAKVDTTAQTVIINSENGNGSGLDREENIWWKDKYVLILISTIIVLLVIIITCGCIIRIRGRKQKLEALELQKMSSVLENGMLESNQPGLQTIVLEENSQIEQNKKEYMLDNNRYECNIKMNGNDDIDDQDMYTQTPQTKGDNVVVDGWNDEGIHNQDREGSEEMYNEIETVGNIMTIGNDENGQTKYD